jgi:nucleotide-binding universal stress UspA family protein
MRGTIVCGVTDGDEGRGALALAAELSQRLGLRLVLAHVADGIVPLDLDGEETAGVTTRAGREGAARLVARLAAEHGVADSAEQRSAVGDPAALLGQIAAEEAADLIVVGSRARGRLRRGLESRLARQLETETPVPVVIASPWARGAGKATAQPPHRR